MLAVLLLALLTAPGPQADASTVDVATRARTLLAEGAAERALQLLEAELAGRPEDASLQRALAHTLEGFVDGGGSWLAMSDARDAWDRALALAPEDLDAQRGAIAVRLRLGEYDSALALAERALGAAWLAGGTAPPVLLELACRARLGALPARDAREGSAGEERAAAVARAWAALRHARTLASASPELVRLAAGLLDGEGLPERAAAELVAAIERAPAAAELHRALVDLYVREGLEERLSALYERWSGAGTNATLAWFAGFAWRLGGDQAQRERRFGEALAAYERASQWLGVAATLEPSFRATADTLRFQAQVSSVWCELDSGAVDAAGERALSLLRAELARRDELDGLGRSLMHALAALGEARVAQSEFAQAAVEARAVVARVPEDGAWWNNLGFVLREHGTQIASGALPDVRERELRARETYRESWQAYRRAAELLPDDVRVLNDAALVQVYHLRDNLGEAEALLERALELGEVALVALGPQPDERVRFALAQALGDAALNLGYLHYHVFRQSERARAAFERARASASGERPEIADYLAAIDGQRGPVPEPDRGLLVGPPRGGQARPARVEVAWQAGLAEARARASSEDAAMLVYQRGDALGLGVGALDELVVGAEFARRTRGLVLVLGDARRHTFVERRRDGRRVSCPHFGTLTCGEHVRAADEIRVWLGELLGHEPGEAEEGLWLLAPLAELPVHVRDLAALEILLPAEPTARGAAGFAGEPFEALEASLGGEDGGSEARALVNERCLAARLALEEVLWDGFRSGPARDFVLAALAEDAGPSARELLAACVRQGADPELQLAALALWPPGFELDPVVHVWRWSPRPEVRAAAQSVVVRERPDDPRLRAEALFR